MRTITSRQNSTVRAFRELMRKRRAGDPRVLIDGWHLLVEARQAGVRIEYAAFAADPQNARETATAADDLAASGAEVFVASESVMEAISPVRTPSGVVAIGRHEAASLSAVHAHVNPLVLLAVDVQDPGNLGAMVRAAEAAGATGLVACGASADPLGWKALRGSMGSAFRLPIARAPIDEAMRSARTAGVPLFASVARVGRPMFDVDLTGPAAFLLGAEGSGLPLGLLQQVDAAISIPMRAPVESLNVAVASALLLYEAMRQRSAAA
jgi:RNA methyltransferase, TrmH family